MVELAELFLGIQGVGSSEVVEHTINAAGIVWEKSGSSFIISQDEDIYTSTMYSTGNYSSSSSSTRAPFNWIWLSQQGRVSPWGLGLYKITNSKESNKYFYLDTRDNEYVESGVNPDVWFVYRSNSGKYYCINKCDDIPIENGSFIRVSDILGYTSKTDKLQDFWNNTLVSLIDNNNPRLIWGPHPTFQATNYKVYRTISFTPLAHPEIYASLIATLNSSTYEYIDGDIYLSSNGDYVYYFVKAYNGSYSGASNIAQVRGSLYKENTLSEAEQKLKFNLCQNYPNPFNPATSISFSIAENCFVSLKIYDILGNEIAELVSGVREPGNYSVSFDASTLSSGLYFYKFITNGYSSTKKMLLAK